MLSALILTKRRYRAVPLAGQPVHGRFVLSGPLVLGKSPLKFRRPWRIGDRQYVTLQKPHQKLIVALWRLRISA